MSQLNANASEWKPSGNPAASFLTDLSLPPAVVDSTPSAHGEAAPAEGVAAAELEYPHHHHHHHASPPPPPPPPAAAAAAAYYPSFAAPASAEVDSVVGEVDWAATFARVMELTEQMIAQQLRPEAEGSTAAAAADTSADEAKPSAAAGAGAGAATTTSPSSAPKKTYAAALMGGGPKGAKEKERERPRRSSNSATPSLSPALAPSDVGTTRSSRRLDPLDSRSLPPLTANGNRRWKKPTKAQQKREQAQRGAFEAFAGALLHSVSPFMAPLRAKCRKALPHIKIDQRFGKSGQPQTAIAQFIAAPLVTNYRPRHFHDVSPGDLEEFMWELAHVLEVMPSSYSLIIGYGPVWKRYAVPYLYIACRDYQREVQALCPDEVPNARAEAIYEDDVVKDITEVVLAVSELDFLEEMSIVGAMKARAKFQPMFDAFDQVFLPLENYQIEITNLRETPSRFHLKTSQLEVDQKPQPITLYNDPDLWTELPVVKRVVVRTTTTLAAEDPRDALDGRGGSDNDNDSDDGDDGAEAPAAAPQKTAAAAVGGVTGGGGAAAAAGAGGVPMWAVVTPVALSVLCTVATVGILMAKRTK